jgi:hypothetical protein
VVPVVAAAGSSAVAQLARVRCVSSHHHSTAIVVVFVVVVVVVGRKCCCYEDCQRSTWLSIRWLVSHFTANRELQARKKSVRLANSVAPAVEPAVGPAVGASPVADVASGAPASALKRALSALSSITCSV